MKLLAEIGKDGKNFLRERRTLMLLVAAPLIVLLILSGVFGKGTSESTLPVSMGLCDLDRSNASSLFIGYISGHADIREFSHMGDCPSYLRTQVSQGRLSAAIIIPKGFGNGIARGESQNITVLLDNSRVQISPSIEAFMKAAAQGTGQEIGTRFILNVWSRLDEADARLAELSVDVSASREKAVEMQAKISSTYSELAALDFSSPARELDAAGSALDGAEAELLSAQSNLTLMQGRLASYESELESTESDLIRLKGLLDNMSLSISTALLVADCSNPLFIPYCASLHSMDATVSTASLEVDERLGKVNATRAELSEINRTMEDFRGNIDASLGGADELRARISSMEGFMAELEESRGESLRMMEEINSSASQIVSKSGELQELISQSRAQIGEITSRDALSVISPIIFSSENMFQSRTFFDFLLPSLIALILMFVSLFLSSTSLVREKNMMALERVYVSQVPLWEYALIKSTSYTIVLFPEILLLLLTASLAYGAFPLADLGLTAFLCSALFLMLFAFNSLGIAVAAFSESEATAFLASLVIGLPLLFMSGILFPFEFMPAPMVALGKATPLTPTITAMQSGILYASPDFSVFWTLAAYCIVLVAAAAGALYYTRGRK